MSGITLDEIDSTLHTIAIASSSGDELAIDASGHVSINDGGNSITVDSGGVDLGVVSNFEYAEDAAHADGSVGAFVLAVRSDTKASTAGTDGDYAALIQDSDGDLYVSDTVAQGFLSTLAGAVAGTEVQVDIVASLPAGSNNIGDVDVASSNTDVVEDEAAVGGETMALIAGVRQDANTSPVSADGDYHYFVFNDQGELKVNSRLDDVSNSSVVVTTTTVDTTAGGVQLVSSALTSRRDIIIQNLGNSDVWLKDGTGVTAGSGGNGFKLPKGSSLEKKWGDAIDLYGITDSGTASIKVVEAA